MLSLRRYTPSDAREWDAFVEASKNGTLLFLRGYMDYHGVGTGTGRFRDCSFMYYNAKGRLRALLPANIDGDTLWSHQGLTYGGFILSEDTRAEEVLELFDLTLAQMKHDGVKTWMYKQVPTIYHRCPAQEDDYALWRNGATLKSCLVSTAIPLNDASLYPPIERRRHRGEHRAAEGGCKVVESERLELFWPIMEANLHDRYGVAPVHTLEEMQLLKSRFPERIRLFLVARGEAPPQPSPGGGGKGMREEGRGMREEGRGMREEGRECRDEIATNERRHGCVREEDTVVAGAVVYECNDRVVHIQYGHATPMGKEVGAMDLLYLNLMERYREKGFAYFDFGNSNEQGGWYLNESLIAQKEGFGGRSVVYRMFEMREAAMKSQHTRKARGG